MEKSNIYALFYLLSGALMSASALSLAQPDGQINFRADDKVRMYADGNFIAELANWQKPGVATFPATTEVLAFELSDTHLVIAGFLASISNGMVTNDNGDWMCTDTEPTGGVPENLALEKPVLLSKGYNPDGDSVDGCLETSHACCSGVHKAVAGGQIWWVVDLGSVYSIDHIIVRNGDSVVHSSATTTGNFDVIALSEWPDKNSALEGTRCATHTGLIPENDFVEIECNTKTQYLGIQQNAPMLLCEVEVYGPAATSDDWKMSGFETTSDWEIATVVGNNGDRPWGPMADVSPDAKWIWLPDWENHRNIYCRVSLGNPDDCVGVTCSDKGTCIDGINSYTCDCENGYIGDDCEDYERFDCDENNPCSPETIVEDLFYYPAEDDNRFVQCDEHGGCFVMPCAPGTKWNQDLLTCVHADNIDDCNGVTCNDRGYCIDGNYTYTCICAWPWTGKDCEDYERYDCDDNSPCKPLLVRGLYYYPAEDDNKFVQCDDFGGCFIMPCAPGTEWSPEHTTCDHARKIDNAE